MLLVLTLAIPLSSLTQPEPTVPWGVPYNQLTEEEKTWACPPTSHMVLCDMQVASESGQLQHYFTF